MCLSDTAPRELLPSGHFPREEPWAQGSDSSGIRGPGRRRYRATPDHRATLQSQAAKAARCETVTLQSLKRDGEKKRALAMGPHVSLQEPPPPLEENYRVLTAVRSPKFTKPQRTNPLRPK